MTRKLRVPSEEHWKSGASGEYRSFNHQILKLAQESGRLYLVN